MPVLKVWDTGFSVLTSTPSKSYNPPSPKTPWCLGRVGVVGGVQALVVTDEGQLETLEILRARLQEEEVRLVWASCRLEIQLKKKIQPFSARWIILFFSVVLYIFYSRYICCLNLKYAYTHIVTKITYIFTGYGKAD